MKKSWNFLFATSATLAIAYYFYRRHYTSPKVINQMDMKNLLLLIRQSYKNAVNNKALQIINVDSTIIRENNINYTVRFMKKGFATKKENGFKPPVDNSVDPFLKENHENDLVIKSIGDKYTLLLNKFPVFVDHTLLVTNEFVSQNDDLTLEDCERILEVTSDMSSFVFYNKGLLSGASQPHKHIQIIPMSSLDCSIPFVDILTNKNVMQVGRAEILPFYHSYVILNKKTNPSELYESTLALRNFCVPCSSYNLIYIHPLLFYVPRSKSEYQTGVPLNSIGYVGFLFANSEESVEVIRSHGPMNILASCGLVKKD